ncbi:MAG: methylenetetrahydrofolate reductase [NAD(P)H] [Verrucomicrobia bacterium]|nr:methylenetetrahydrofolate reductase [NAD(P)H] [Verrucomicrobiota bacterium]
MHIRDILTAHRPSFSFEFFPPKTPEGAETLFQTIRELEALHPAFVSVTYGAGGTTRELTHDLVVRIKRETSLDPVPHLTCVCHSETDIAAIIERYAQAGVSNILALGGDPPKNLAGYDKSKDAFQHAADLVSFIKKFNHSGVHSDQRGFGIGVAGFPDGHPATPNRLLEMDYLKAKVDAGADYICTQMFFNNHNFDDFRERCQLAGITVPIIAGIMPITSASGMKRMADLAGGVRFPAKLLKLIAGCGEDEAAVQRAGIEYATEQCADLLKNKVDGIHFYTLNKSMATQEIYTGLGLRS